MRLIPILSILLLISACGRNDEPEEIDLSKHPVEKVRPPTVPIKNGQLQMPIGIQNTGGLIVPVLAETTPVPASTSTAVGSILKDQNSFELAVHIGSSPLKEHCHELARYRVTASAASVTIAVDKAGKLSVKSGDDELQPLKVSPITEDEAIALGRLGQQHVESDRKKADLIRVRNRGQLLLRTTRELMPTLQGQIPADKLQDILSAAGALEAAIKGDDPAAINEKIEFLVKALESVYRE